MSRSAKYVEDLTIAVFKFDSEGLDAVNEGYFSPEDFADEDYELSEALENFQMASARLEAIIEARRDEYEIEVS